jgi:hypothetical protein
MADVPRLSAAAAARMARRDRRALDPGLTMVELLC